MTCFLELALLRCGFNYEDVIFCNPSSMPTHRLLILNLIVRYDAKIMSHGILNQAKQCLSTLGTQLVIIYRRSPWSFCQTIYCCCRGWDHFCAMTFSMKCRWPNAVLQVIHLWHHPCCLIVSKSTVIFQLSKSTVIVSFQRWVKPWMLSMVEVMSSVSDRYLASAEALGKDTSADTDLTEVAINTFWWQGEDFMLKIGLRAVWGFQSRSCTSSFTALQSKLLRSFSLYIADLM